MQTFLVPVLPFVFVFITTAANWYLAFRTAHEKHKQGHERRLWWNPQTVLITVIALIAIGSAGLQLSRQKQAEEGQAAAQKNADEMRETSKMIREDTVNIRQNLASLIKAQAESAATSSKRVIISRPRLSLAAVLAKDLVAFAGERERNTPGGFGTSGFGETPFGGPSVDQLLTYNQETLRLYNERFAVKVLAVLAAATPADKSIIDLAQNPGGTAGIRVIAAVLAGATGAA